MKDDGARRVVESLNKLREPKKAKILTRFFKTGPGEYGEGDVFLGLTVPQQRQIALKFAQLPLGELQQLLKSRVHEHRLVALLILVIQFQKSDGEQRERIVSLYLKNTKRINNWDLVDLSAPKILGAWLLDKKRDVLFLLARSENLWEKRISILSTFEFIKNDQCEDTLKIAELLLIDRHDLIHKAVGWMLREIGKRDQRTEEEFLKKHASQMPRTMLRYAIEKFDEKTRRFYLGL